MSQRLKSFLVATGAYALLLGLAALILPDPRNPRLGMATPPQPGVAVALPPMGFHVSIFGALIAGVIMAMLLSGIRAWLTQRISGTGFHWPTLAGGFLAVLLVLVIANGFLGQNIFYIRGWLGWIVTPVLVCLGTFAFERFDNHIVRYAKQATNKVQGQITTIRQNLPPAA